ncbi:hypothetical protein KIN20_008711 [Parelaphostrongylus tenuis]|uniref:Uncharacterized protein n=1 Tax=Parelaphostrongylus tenuis TaxID=148309 RepID=A0AAD5M754_PARTN|nr:hypothetical protein KIN20_008711 [Parelaphostrongylus tenuis]
MCDRNGEHLSTSLLILFDINGSLKEFYSDRTTKASQRDRSLFRCVPLQSTHLIGEISTLFKKWVVVSEILSPISNNKSATLMRAMLRRGRLQFNHLQNFVIRVFGYFD